MEKLTYDREKQRLTYGDLSLYARSGSLNHKNSSWSVGKSPIPRSSEVYGGKIWLWCSGIKSVGRWAFGTGIGEFWSVSSEPDKITILSKTKTHKRTYIGIHPENSIPGSAGCIVLVNETKEQKDKILKLRRKILDLNVEKILLEVI